MKLFIYPSFGEQDVGDGGIRRVVEAQRKYLPLLGIEVVATPDAADICAFHGGDYFPTGKPSVVHTHGLYWSDSGYEWEDWAHTLNKQVVAAMRQADAVTAPSKWVAYVLQRGLQIDPVVLYHGIDPDEWPQDADTDGYILWNKTRVDSICDPLAVNILAEKFRDHKFVSTFAEPAPNIQITGRLPFDQARSYIQRAGIYLATSRETFGIGTLEAMVCGVPVLGFGWGGQAEIIEHKVTGYLARPYDYDSLAAGLEYCLAHREELGRNAKLVAARNFTWATAMERYATLYRQVLLSRSNEKHSPRVSVVITCYNLANALPSAVESVVNQEDWELSDSEIIIVNDNSPDDTASVAEDLALKYKKANIRVVTNEENLYLAGALNAGISSARGNYIIPLDADNQLGPRALSVLSSALDNGYKNPGNNNRVERIDIAYGAMQVVDEAGITPTFISSWPSQFNFNEQMRHRNQCPSTSMFRRSVWTRINGYRRRCRTAEDADFWCRATSFGAVARRVTDAVCLVYHDRSNSMSHVEKDWDWTAWYTWSRLPKLTPFGAARADTPAIKLQIPTYEPALITVIIPVGPGHEAYLIDAIDSLVAQTFVNWRVIVVNDTGSDNLPALPPFVYILDTNNSPVGPAAARNLGIAASNTPLWLPLDADDYLQPDALERLYITWKNSDPRYYVYGDWYVQETGERQNADEYDCEAVLQRLPHAVTALYTREMWQRVGGFDASMQAWEDWDFVIALAEHGYCGVRIDAPVFQYRLKSGGRRDDMYTRKEELKEVIRTKYSKYITDKEPLMACGGCGRAAASMQQSPQSAPAPAGIAGGAVNVDGTVLLEYTGTSAAVTYRGQATGTSYRFGNTGGRSLKYVYARDAEAFLLRPEFILRDDADVPGAQTQPVLEAAGPPAR